MDRLKVEAFFKEFPFLARFIPVEKVRDVKVSRVNREFLAERHWTLSEEYGYSRKYWSQLYFLDKDGNEIEDAPNFQWMEEYSKFSFWRPWTWGKYGKYLECRYDGEETVGQALTRIENPENIFYVLRVTPVRYTQANVNVLVLYKSPKGFTLTTWLEEQRKRAEQEVRQEIAGIDNAEVEAKA